MASSSQQRPVDLDAFASATVWIAASLIGGAVGGIALAELLRARRLAWTWAVVAAPVMTMPVLLIAAVDPALAVRIAPAAAAGSITAVAWGLRRRLDERRAGGDHEARASQRRGVLDAARARAAGSRRGSWEVGETLPLGWSARGRLAGVRRGTASSGSHVLIPGATGAGKTTSLASLLVEYVARSGFGAVVLEAKNDPALLAAARAAARSRDARFSLVSSDGPNAYDPLARGTADERSERLIAVEAWGSQDADFYRQAASPFLRLALRALDSAGVAPSLREAAMACEPDELENRAAVLDDADLADEIVQAVSALRADERRAVAGLRARIFNLADSDFARRWLDPADSKTAIDLRAAITRREVVYFRFDTDRTGNVGRAIAQMVLLDLGAAASSMMGEGIGTFVAVDEFGALQAPALDRLYTRGRSAGMSVAIGTQTVADLREAGPALLERIGATVESLVCHRIGNQEDAEWLAQLIGTVGTWQTTTRTDGLGQPSEEGTRTRGYRFEVHPAELQRLGAGEAYVARLDLGGSKRASKVGVVPPWNRVAIVPERVGQGNG